MGGRDPTVVLSAPPYPLFVREGDGFLQASEPVVLECARRLACAKFTDGGAEVRNSEALYDFLSMQLSARDHEVFTVLLLDANRKLIEYVELFHGTTEYVSVQLLDHLIVGRSVTSLREIGRWS